MGIAFCDKNHRKLSDMSNDRAHLFIALTLSIAQHYKIPPGLSSVSCDVCYVEEEEFCSLVEKVIFHPLNLLYAWAEQAAAIYEVLNGNRCQWEWRERETPHFPFRPNRHKGLTPELESNKLIGPDPTQI